MALKFVKVVAEGGLMPFGYGIAWPKTYRDRECVCMPVPFNVLARVLRDAWIYMRFPGSVAVNPRVAYLQGYAEGRMSTFDDMASMGVELGRREDQS